MVIFSKWASQHFGTKLRCHNKVNHTGHSHQRAEHRVVHPCRGPACRVCTGLGHWAVRASFAQCACSGWIVSYCWAHNGQCSCISSHSPTGFTWTQSTKLSSTERFHWVLTRIPLNEPSDSQIELGIDVGRWSNFLQRPVRAHDNTNDRLSFNRGKKNLLMCRMHTEKNNNNNNNSNRRSCFPVCNKRVPLASGLSWGPLFFFFLRVIAKIKSYQFKRSDTLETRIWLAKGLFFLGKNWLQLCNEHLKIQRRHED